MDTEQSELLVNVISPQANRNATLRVRCQYCDRVNHVHLWTVATIVRETGAHSFHCFDCHEWQYNLTVSALDPRDLRKIT